MGKSRERKLREAFEELSANFARKTRIEVEKQRETDEGLATALASMGNEPLVIVIVTKSGHVVTGRASITIEPIGQDGF